MYDLLVEASDGVRATMQRLSVVVITAAAEPGRPPVSAPADPTPIAQAGAATSTASTVENPAAASATVARTVPRVTIDQPLAPPSAGRQAIDQDPSRPLTASAVARPVDPLSRAAIGIPTTTHRIELDATLLSLNTPVANTAATRADNRAHYSADAGNGSAEAPTATASAHSPALITMGIALSIGVIGWASRGAALVASLLASSPAWRSYDLLPVLRRRSEDADWGDDDLDDTPLGETDLAPLDAAAGTTRSDHDIMELH